MNNLDHSIRKPLVIYLDSSDFSVLADSSKRTAEIIAIENQLLHWKKLGLIEFRFSYVHIIEAAATEHKYNHLASDRFSLMKRVCDNNCLVSPIHILENEVLNLSKNEVDRNINLIFDDNGEWFPALDGIEDSVYLKDNLLEEINTLHDRKSRRKAMRQGFNKNGSVKESFRKQLANSSSQSLEELTNKLPIPRHLLEAAFKQYSLNDSTIELKLALRKSLSDLDNLGVWYENDWDRVSPISTFLRDIGLDVKNALALAVNKYSANFKQLKLAGIDEKEIQKLITNQFSAMAIDIPISFANKLATTLKLTLTQQPNSELTPSMFTMGALAASIGKLTLINSRSAKASDFGDIYHSVYLPHVDIFRSDGFVAEAIEGASLPFKTVVVGKFTDLINSIEKLL